VPPSVVPQKAEMLFKEEELDKKDKSGENVYIKHKKKL
jgi:hypothetical protein